MKSADSAARIAATPPGYRLFDHPRPDRNGGGTGILARDSLVVKQARAGICDTFEYSEWIIVSGSACLCLVSCHLQAALLIKSSAYCGDVRHRIR